MKILVIPDVHLKPWMFALAKTLLADGHAERAVCLMDLADDWNQEMNIDLYIETYEAAIRFAEDAPETLWCYGNHDVSYLWDRLETGFSVYAQETVCAKLQKLFHTVRDGHLAFVHRIDDVLFSHAGVSDRFVKLYLTEAAYTDIDLAVSEINDLGAEILWGDLSPVWFRPQGCPETLFMPERLLQVVGHTPVKTILEEQNLISCDVFSTYSNGTPIGTQEFLVVDTSGKEKPLRIR